MAGASNFTSWEAEADGLKKFERMEGIQEPHWWMKTDAHTAIIPTSHRDIGPPKVTLGTELRPESQRLQL